MQQHVGVCCRLGWELPAHPTFGRELALDFVTGQGAMGIDIGPVSALDAGLGMNHRQHRIPGPALEHGLEIAGEFGG